MCAIQIIHNHSIWRKPVENMLSRHTCTHNIRDRTGFGYKTKETAVQDRGYWKSIQSRSKSENVKIRPGNESTCSTQALITGHGPWL